MKKILLSILTYFTVTMLYGQSVEFSPSGPVNLKLGNYYSPSSPSGPSNKLVIYNRGSESSGLTLIDSAIGGSNNVSAIYSEAGESTVKGFFMGNFSDSPVVIFNKFKNTNNLFLTPNGNVGIGCNIYGIANTQKLHAKLHVKGIGDSLYNISQIGNSAVGVLVNGVGKVNSNTTRIGLVSQMEGSGSSVNNVTNIGLYGSPSLTDTSQANGIGVAASSFLKTTGFSSAMTAKSKNLGFGPSYGLQLESSSSAGATYGATSSVSGGLLNFGFYSNVSTVTSSPSPSYGYYSNIQNASNSNAVYGYYADISKVTGSASSFGFLSKINNANGISGIGTYSRVSTINAPAFGSFSNAIGNNQNYGVFGFADGGIQNIAIYGGLGETASITDFAGYFSGNVHVNGILSKSSGTFKIDHPLDPENKTLSHSFVESPEMMNIYNGNITTDNNGESVVQLPTYFEALNENFRYQLTVIGKFAQAIVFEKIKGNSFKIKTDLANTEVSWQVTGTRKDAFAKQNPIVVEQNKADKDKGKYLNPKAFNKTTSHSMHQIPELN
ncbi:hypothetical protein [Lacihabitans soyangensis]|uniref:Peptidase S74 domain-containing protein n=1 Tax=Lacihabitans soyangensis TaxID=869394 RepID=A0AAE3KSJ0_9BACT|nr:hypothetical protein [Lacihabitans soyangensis]MCP9763417.1 hypothetical protein [Lacihabitans soyangensis]